MTKKNIILIIVVIAAVGGSILLWQNIQKQLEKYTGPIEKVRLSAYLGEFSGLIWIAENKGYFKDNGLDVTIKTRQSGVEAMQDLLDGSADISDEAEFVAVAQSFDRNDFKILASIDSISAMYTVARKDHGIGQISDLKGKKIGVTKGSQAEFFLGTFLTFNNLNLSDVQIIFLTPAEIKSKIASGEIDAALTWQPYVYQIKKNLGENGIAWPAQSGQEFSFLLTGSKELVEKRPQVVERFLKAMLQAEQVDAKEQQVILKNRLNDEQSYIQEIWPNNDFQVELNQKLMPFMEDEARFEIENKLTDKTEIPDYFNFIYFNALEKIKLEAMTIIH